MLEPSSSGAWSEATQTKTFANSHGRRDALGIAPTLELEPKPCLTWVWFIMQLYFMHEKKETGYPRRTNNVSKDILQICIGSPRIFFTPPSLWVRSTKSRRMSDRGGAHCWLKISVAHFRRKYGWAWTNEPKPLLKKEVDGLTPTDL